MKPPLLSFDEALATLMSRASAVSQTEDVPTEDCQGRILARDLRSSIDVPGMDNTSMDGYAVRASEVHPGVPMPVSQRIAAGQVGSPLARGTAARIFTGAMLPEGADAVIMQEAAQADGESVSFSQAPESGQWVRRRGEDIAAGGLVLPAGTLLTPQAAGLAASVGCARLTVRRRVRVGCFFTGDELAMPGEPLRPGAIYNSNRFVLTALLKRLGCEVVDLGIVPDSLQATREALILAARGNDLIVTSGGMSVGEEDHVKPAVQAEGELSLWSIAIKPGKPLAHGRIGRDEQAAHFIGLPGNPVSAWVTFLMFVRPFVRALQGALDTQAARLRLPAGFDWPKPDRRREFLRARVDAQGQLELFPNQGSAVLTSCVWADGLIDNPPSQAIARGDTVTFIPFSELLA
jgi:molybdopterin molybdotransferase